MGISDLKVFGRLAAVFGMQLYSHCLAVCVWAASSFHPSHGAPSLFCFVRTALTAAGTGGADGRPEAVTSPAGRAAGTLQREREGGGRAKKETQRANHLYIINIRWGPSGETQQVCQAL